MARGTVSQILEAECFVDQVANAHGVHADKSFLCRTVRVHHLELLKVKTKQNHFALKMKLYLRANQVAFDALRELAPVRFAA